MGSYEEEYRKYYSNTKAKLNIKSEIKSYTNKYTLEKEKKINLNSSDDIYPKSNYIHDEGDIYNKEEQRINYIIEDSGKGTYKGVGTYSGIENYNNQNSYRGFDGSAYYVNSARQNSNSGGEEKNILSNWGKRVAIELFLTLVLFVSVIGIKNLPYKESKTVYGFFKEIVNTNFDYKNFIEDVITIDVMKEVDKIKENLKIKPQYINTFKAENNDEKIDDITLDEAKESTDYDSISN